MPNELITAGRSMFHTFCFLSAPTVFAGAPRHTASNMSNDSAHERNGDADELDSSAASAGGERKSMSKKDRRADYVWDTPDLGAKAACSHRTEYHGIIDVRHVSNCVSYSYSSHP
jgi:hypothetical protein